VKYEVFAFAMKRSKILAHTSKEIKIYASNDPSPPLCAADYAGEYTYSRQKPLRTLLFQRHGDLFVNTEEPTPIECTLSEPDLSTLLPIHFNLLCHPRKTTTSTLSPNLLIFDASVSWKLKSTTLVSITKLVDVPTIEQCKKSLQYARVTEYSPSRSRKLRLQDWDVHDDIGSIEKPVIGAHSYTHNTTVWLSIPTKDEDAYPPPTFSSPYLSRKYSFTVRIDVCGSLGRASFNLEVPVQIVYGHSRVSTPDEANEALSDANSQTQEGDRRSARYGSGAGHEVDVREHERERLPSYVA
jgi:hypothetical protein